MHPDLFDGMTPIRERVVANVQAYKVALRYFEPVEENYYVVAESEEEAEAAAWEKSSYTIDCNFDNCEDIEALDDDEKLNNPWFAGNDGCDTAGELVAKHLAKKEAEEAAQ